MRSVLLYLAGLAVAATAVFFAAYLLGRHPSLEAELERLTAPRAPAPEKSQGIRSLRQPEAPPALPAAVEEPSGEALGEGVRVRRAPLEEPGLVVVADLESLFGISSGPPEAQRRLREGLESFFAQPPAGLRLGLRPLAGAPGDCGGTTVARTCGRWSPEELRVALEEASSRPAGPRNPAKAAREAAGDLDGVPGERGIVLLAGGPEGCGADLCSAAPAGDAGPPLPRVHVVLLAPPPPPSDPGSAPAGAAQLPTFAPTWAAPYRCLAERTGGTVTVAAGPEELDARLRRVARLFEAAVAVRAMHLRGQEVQGSSPDAGLTWGASLASREEGEGAAAVRLSPAFPAVFAVPGGAYDLRGWFGGLERTATVAVAPGERAEVSLAFDTGELFVQALDTGGGEIAGDSAGFGCGWGADVLREGEEKPVATTCSLPARLELPSGEYRVRLRWKGKTQEIEGVTVEGGESAVRTVDFSGPQE
jgi:hypothetical protein